MRRAFSTRIAGEVKGFDPLQFVEKKEVKKLDVFIQYALAASQFAVDDARLVITPDVAPRVGVMIASGIGGFTTIEREHRALLEGGPRRISPFFIPAAIINLAAGHVSIRFGAKGPNSATCTACAASAHAIGDAFEIIRRGDADAMIAGGSEAAITPDGRRRLRRHARPLHPQRRARARQPALRPRPRRVRHRRGGRRAGARGPRVRPAPRRDAAGRGRRLRDDLRRVPHHRRSPRTPTARCAACRARSPRPAWRPRSWTTSTPTAPPRRSTTPPRPRPSSAASATTPYRLAVSSTKSMTGHLLGAAGGLEAGICVLALRAPGGAADDQPRHAGRGLRSRLRAARGAAARHRLRAVELVRVRRHQRGAAVQAVRVLTRPGARLVTGGADPPRSPAGASTPCRAGRAAHPG